MQSSSTPQEQHSSPNRVIYCINPECKQRENPDNLECCQACGTPLLIENRYRLIFPLRPLSPRGQAEVFEVEDLGVEAATGERNKVLKVLEKNEETLVRLFKQEAKILNELTHPAIPKIQDSDFTVSLPRTSKLLHCLVMEKIEGENLQEWVKTNGPVSQEQALNWLKELLKILDYLHQHKYFHRDIKPSNIMLRPNGQLVLIDFGTVREMTQTYIVKIGSNREITCVYSWGYTPEEAIQGKAVPQSDFYALGRTFVYLLTGKPPWELPEEAGKLNWRDSAPQVSPLLADWIDYLMASSPDQRPQDTSFILEYLKGKTVKTLPSPPISPPIENLPSHPIEPPSPPTTRLLIILNFVLFSIVLVSGLLWFQRQQENQWQVPRQENSQIRNY
jgi:serine/threonine protein kinase